MKKRYLVPNLFTGLNFLLGIFAIMIMHEAFATPMTGKPILGFSKPPLILAAWMIIWCTMMDKLDGFAARLLKASSEFGAQFDSLADLTAFGIAPGFLVYFYMQTLDYAWFVAHWPLMIVSTAFYMLTASMRLARFNAVDSEELVNFFHGLPSPLGGGMVVLSVILSTKYHLADRYSWGLLAIPLLLILVGVLFVSPLYLPKLMRRQNKAFDLFQMVNVIAGYICGFGMIFPEYLFGALMLYVVGGFTVGFFKKGMIESANEPGPE